MARFNKSDQMDFRMHSTFYTSIVIKAHLCNECTVTDQCMYLTF